MDKLILFDIDGTLTKGRGHPEAFRHGLKAVYGVDGEQPPKGNPGWTDQLIILDVLKRKGLSRKEILAKMQDCMDEMARYYDANIGKRNVEAYEGARELLEELRARGFMLGLVTGNVERIAYTKLGKVGLAEFFSLGGFGSDHTERSELVSIAIRRAQEKGFEPDGSNVFVVGDTAKDIEAGREARARTIAVFSGHNTRKELEDSRPDYFLEHLTEKQRFLEIVG